MQSLEGDVRDQELARACRVRAGCRFHVAAEFAVRRSSTDSQLPFETNVMCTVNP